MTGGAVIARPAGSWQSRGFC